MSTKKYQCLIIDDEPIARKIIAGYIDQMPNLECAGECKNAIEAIEKINANSNIEIIFLDINMPNLNGISMARIISNRLQIIFTTAYTEYAIESYELNAVDYLLKPFLFERFAQSIFKAIDRLRSHSAAEVFESNSANLSTLYIKSQGESFPVQVNEILVCEAMKNYTKVILQSGKTYSPLLSLSKFEAELHSISSNFLRVHRSYIISKKNISSIGSNFVMIEKNKIPIGEQYKGVFLLQLGIK